MASTPENMPGLQPPPGQAPNFSDPWSIRDAIIALMVVFLVTSTLSTLVRIYTRHFVSSNASWDDYLMVAGWVAFVANWAICMRAFKYDAGVHQWDVRLADVESFAYWGFLSELIYGVVICLIKTSICLQVLRIFVVTRDRAFWTIWVFIMVQSAWWFANFWLNVFRCTPVQKGYNPQLDGTCLPGFDNYVITVGVFNVVSDLLMWIYPLVCVSKLHLKLVKKMCVAAVFLVGSLAIAASILRTVFTVRYYAHGEDATFVLTQFGLCTQAEFVCGIIAGNSVTLPMFWIYVRSGFSSLGSSKTSQRSASSGDICQNEV